MPFYIVTSNGLTEHFAAYEDALEEFHSRWLSAKLGESCFIEGERMEMAGGFLGQILVVLGLVMIISSLLSIVVFVLVIRYLIKVPKALDWIVHALYEQSECRGQKEL